MLFVIKMFGIILLSTEIFFILKGYLRYGSRVNLTLRIIFCEQAKNQESGVTYRRHDSNII